MRSEQKQKITIKRTMLFHTQIYGYCSVKGPPNGYVFIGEHQNQNPHSQEMMRKTRKDQKSRVHFTLFFSVGMWQGALGADWWKESGVAGITFWTTKILEQCQTCAIIMKYWNQPQYHTHAHIHATQSLPTLDKKKGRTKIKSRTLDFR